MGTVLSRILRALGVEGEKKPPELGKAISKEELMQEAKGFIAIINRAEKKADIWLCMKAVMMNESGYPVYKNQLDWENYGRTWQAYEINKFEVWPDADSDYAG